MADPRVNIVKPCPPSYLGKSSAEIGQSAASRNSFFNAAGKVGDLEVLNSVGGGKVGEGLRVLAGVSNTIRRGCGSLPTSIGGILGDVADTANSTFTAGTDWALQQMGLDIKTVDAVRAFQPGIANQAWGQAQQVYERVRKGNFKVTDIPSVLQDFQNLERLGRNIFTPGLGDKNNKLRGQCEASPYAIDLIARAPKHKFMFVIQFIPNPGYETFGQLDWAFTAQNASRPSIKYHMEDVNYYNFRSKIITRAEFDPINMKFYDDIRGQSGQFYGAYTKAMSPVLNYAKSNMFENPEAEGMNFNSERVSPAISGVTFTNKTHASSTGVLLESNKTIFREITMFHIFDYGQKMDVFRFFNPRITDIALDDLDMSSSAPSMLDLSFAYDSVYVDTNLSFQDGDGASSAKAASEYAVYPLRYISGPGGMNAPNNNGLRPGAPAGTAANCGTEINTSNPVQSAVQTAQKAVSNFFS